MKRDPSVRAVLRALTLLQDQGILLLQDPLFTNVASLCAGAKISGSWWSHPRGKLIFRVASDLAEHPDVVTAKLVSRKVTFVHRRHWPALIAVGNAKEDWQFRDANAPTRALLRQVESAGSLRASGAAAKDLEIRLLVSSHQVHTETGKHAVELSTWTTLQKRKRVGRLPAVEHAKRSLEELVSAVNEATGARGRLPWP